MVRFSTLLLLSMFLAGCGQLNVQTGTNREADERAIRDLDAEWAKAAAAKNVDQVVTYYADDASMFVPNEPIAMGKPAIRVEWTKLTSNPGYALSFSPSRVDVAKAGDMAYEFGVYSLMLTCRASRVEPLAWLRHVLTELPQRAGDADITDLLPFNFHKAATA